MAKLGRKENKNETNYLYKKEEYPSITYRQLGDMFNITQERDYQIYKGYKDKYEKVR